MGCKCGATVKASKQWAYRSLPSQSPFFQGSKSALQRRTGAEGRFARSGDDGSALERGHRHLQRWRVMLIGALEQHPPFEGGRTHHWITLENLFAHRREIRRHQADRFQQAREEARLRDGLVQEN